jgi:hypothetical protein
MTDSDLIVLAPWAVFGVCVAVVLFRLRSFGRRGR